MADARNETYANHRLVTLDIMHQIEKASSEYKETAEITVPYWEGDDNYPHPVSDGMIAEVMYQFNVIDYPVKAVYVPSENYSEIYHLIGE